MARGFRLLLPAVVVVALGVAGLLTLRGLGILDQLAPGRVKPIPVGDQEIAWIAPATNGETWERLVKAFRLLAKQWRSVHGSDLELDTDRAFLLQSTDIPEIGLRQPGSGTLWVRWYKLSGSNDLGHWVGNLQRRPTAPLAIVGGETTDRAIALAEILSKKKADWRSSSPLFLITTATAERFLPPHRPDLELDHDHWPRLMGVYPGRSFRFSFTNSHMVKSVLDFLHDQPQVWRTQPAKQPAKSPFFLFTLTWLDDGYSTDLSSQFQSVYRGMVQGKEKTDPIDGDLIQYGVGDFFQPNPREEMSVGLFLANSKERGDRPQLLVLPSGTQRARRFLRTLCRRAPREIRNLVVANGDAISFNNIYRDRDVAWNIQDVPVPLVFFSHRNPIDPKAGFGKQETSSTQDLLLFRDLFEAILVASFRDGKLLSDADEVLGRLRDTAWLGEHLVNAPPKDNPAAIAFFDDEGNRRPNTGEHIVLLEPVFEDETRVLPRANISVWRYEFAWVRVGQPLPVFYDRSSPD